MEDPWAQLNRELDDIRLRLDKLENPGGEVQMLLCSCKVAVVVVFPPHVHSVEKDCPHCGKVTTFHEAPPGHHNRIDSDTGGR